MSTRRKTSGSRVENQQTQPTYDTGSANRTRATLVGGECSHHCAIPASHSHLNDMQIPGTKRFILKGFGLGPTLS